MTLRELSKATGLSLGSIKMLFSYMRYDGILIENRDYFIDTVFTFCENNSGRNEIFMSDEGIIRFYTNREKYDSYSDNSRRSFREVSALLKIDEQTFAGWVLDGSLEKGIDYGVYPISPYGKQNDARRVRYIKESGWKKIKSLTGRQKYVNA